MTQHGNRRLRRLGVLVAVPTISALTLAACGGGGDSGSTGDAKAADSFTFAFGNSTGAENPFQLAAEKYQKEKGVKIEVKSQPQDSYGLTLRTQLQGGNAADVFVVSPGAGQESAVLPMAEAGYIEPLGQESTDLIPEGNEGLFQVDGKTYAQPTDITPVGIIWNQDAAKKAGVEPPADFDSMIDDCRQLAGDGNSLFALSGAFPPNTGLMAQSISATRVYAETPDWNKQRAAGDVTFADSQGWKDTLQTILDMNEAGCFQKGAAGAGVDVLVKAFAAGPSVSGFAPAGSATEIMKTTPGLTLNIEPFPADGGEPYLLASPNYAVAVNAKADQGQKLAAEEFLAWLAEPANAADFVEASGGVAITGPDDNLNPVYGGVADLLTGGKYAALPNLEWPNPGVYDALSTGVQGLIGGQSDIPTVLESMDRAWDQ